MVGRFTGRSRASRTVAVDMDACIGQRESPTPHNTLAHRHWQRHGQDAKRAREAMQRHASAGKLLHTTNQVLGNDRYEFSDGSLLVFSFSAVYVVDVNCSASLRAYFNRLGPAYAPMEARYIEDQRWIRSSLAMPGSEAV